MQATLGPNVTNLQTQRFAFSFVSPNGKQPATLKKGHGLARQLFGGGRAVPGQRQQKS